MMKSPLRRPWAGSQFPSAGWLPITLTSGEAPSSSNWMRTCAATRTVRARPAGALAWVLLRVVSERDRAGRATAAGPVVDRAAIRVDAAQI